MHTFAKEAEKVETNVVCQKANGNCFCGGQDRSTDGGINETRGHNNLRSVLRNTKKLRRVFQKKKRRGMLTSGVVLLHDISRPHRATHTRALLEHFNWELFEHPNYSPDLAPSDYTYLFVPT
jgi:hypothetical protein